MKPMSNRLSIIAGLLLMMVASQSLASSNPFESGDSSNIPTGSDSSESCPTLSNGIVDVFSNIDWDNAFPITIAGFGIGGGDNPPRMGYDSPLCNCNWRLPGLSAIPFGISFSYWAPMYIVESTNKSGCLITLNHGGSLLPGYEGQNSGRGQMQHGSESGQRRQMHFYTFALFKLLDLFNEVACGQGTKGFDLAYLTEIDSTWQDDTWSTVFFPEASLFATPVARVACMVEAAKIDDQKGYNIDALFWCAGPSHLYPVSGNSNVTGAAEDTNMKALARFLYKQHRTSFLSTHIGDKAECFAQYSPRLPKQQYRIDPVFPSAVDSVSTPIVLGRKYLFWDSEPPTANYPSHESAAYALWRGTQCCLRF